jgi:hypothetical protein
MMEMRRLQEIMNVLVLVLMLMLVLVEAEWVVERNQACEVSRIGWRYGLKLK